MTRNTIIATASILLCSMFLTSCASTADGRKTQGQGAAVGAAIGGLLAGGLAYALTGDTSSAARFAAVGAGVGALQGFAYGTAVASKKQDYVNQEDYLTYAIGEAEKRNQEAIAYNKKLESDVRALEARVKTVPTERKDKSQLKKDFDIQLSSVNKEEKKYDAYIQDLNSALEGDGYGNKPQSAQLKKQISKLESEKAALQGRRTRLAAGKARLSV